MRKLGIALLSLASLTAWANEPVDPAWVSAVKAVQAKRVDQFKQQSHWLHEAVKALCIKPGVAGLNSARRAWVDADSALHGVEAAAMGPTLARRTVRVVGFRPTRVEMIETAVAEADVEPSLAASGLPALEYLLFDKGDANRQLTLLRQAKRCQYTTGRAAAVEAEALALQADWQAFLTQTTGSEAVVADLVNQSLGLIDSWRSGRYAKLRRDKPLQAAEYLQWRDGTSRRLANHLSALEALWQAGDAGHKLADVAMVRGGKPDLATRLTAAMASLRDTQKAFQQAKPTQAAESLAALQKQMTALRLLLESELAPVLGVTITFNEADGD